MNNVVFVAIEFVAIILLICFALFSDGPKTEPPELKPDIYITRTDHILTFDGGEAWILEYALDGAIQAAMFDSQETMTGYREYLDTIGTVYKGEGEDD
jgi:hypothetical protein